ncbi:MAG: amino acid synthesis family protein, partial [Rhodospirillaceae bacterium]|nr:amino acid synthesis family protein [Rhodospirillaceae bacterium]
MKIRKIVTVVEETRRELDRPVEPAARQAAAIAVIANPYAGVYDEKLEELQQAGAELGALLV